MRNKRDNTVYLQHILDAIEKISKYVKEKSYEEFVSDEWNQDALMRNLEIIGEAANNLDISLRDTFTNIPWRQIIDFRNVVVHDYADLDPQIVWEIATGDLPTLGEQIKGILTKLNE